MRITHNIMVTRLLSDLRSSQARLSTYQQMLSSGKVFSAPSDAPVQVVEALRLRSALDQTGQYLRNAEDALSWVEITDQTLAVGWNVLSRAREVTLSGVNPSLSPQDRDALACEIRELVEHLADIANATCGDRYLFGGQRTMTPPFEVVGDDVVYNGDGGALIREMGPMVTVQINCPGETFVDAFATLKSIAENLEQGNVDNLSGPMLEQLDDASKKILEARAEMGARTNRIELSQTRLGDMKYNMTRLLNNVEDVDYTEVITMLASEENGYLMALNAGARIIQPSLLDFLR